MEGRLKLEDFQHYLLQALSLRRYLYTPSNFQLLFSHHLPALGSRSSCICCAQFNLRMHE